MSLSVRDLSADDAKVFLDFFHKNGASSAKITASCYEEGEGELLRDEDRGFCIERPAPGVAYSINSIEVLNHVIPLFKTKITEIKQSDPARLISYQKKSEHRFKAENLLVENEKKEAVLETPFKKTSSAENIFGLFHQEKTMDAESVVGQKSNTADHAKSDGLDQDHIGGMRK
jgi:hypothetical protein